MRRPFAVLLLPLLGAFAPTGCRTLPAPDVTPVPIVETRRLRFPGSQQLKLRYQVLVHSDGRVERHGKESEWFRGGELRAEREFRHDRPTGVWTTWFEEGGRASEIHFGDGERPAPMRWWYPNGALAAEGQGIAGVKEGAWVYRYEDGTIAEEGVFRASARHGPWTFYYPSGEPQARGRYESDLRVGEWTLWDEEGRAAVRDAGPGEGSGAREASAEPRAPGP